MKLYNTLTRQVEDFSPLNPPKVTLYTCGPTVYDFPHVGNWFTFIRYELLVRTLALPGWEPFWVMNITDVGHLVSDADEGEDKLEKGARREGKTSWDVAKFYGDYFISGMERLGFVLPTYIPKATDHIQEQIDFIKILESKGFTYVIDDGVYYDTSKFPKYADFARLDIDEQIAGKRVELNPQKKNPTDFALWKFSPKDHQRDMEWDSPWGKGFPGWHIECSAMSRKYLGDTIDIHAGGIDHLPVHHTNEIAQSEAATGKQFSRFWMHNNFITVNGDKISKSLNNGITLEDIEGKGFSLQSFRLHVLESHYRSHSKFSWDSLSAAQNRLRNYIAQADSRWQPVDDGSPGAVGSSEIAKARQSLKDALLDDLNTPQALAGLNEIFDRVEIAGIDKSSVDTYNEFLQFINSALGINLLKPDITEDQKTDIANREDARKSQNWSESDRLRQKLSDEGIGINDSNRGPVWYHLNI